MRTAFFETLAAVAERDPRVWLLTGDLGFGVVEPFARKFPDRFVNAGVAEQNMTGVATGLALSGKVVFTYSIGNFPTLRCLEQIRNGPCYHKANVHVVAVGGGLVYGSLGMTHHLTEDLAIMRALPNLTVVAPGDPAEAACAVEALVGQDGPGYLRLGRAGEPLVHAGRPDFTLGRAIRVRDGRDVTLISTGGMLVTVNEVADALARAGVSARVVSMHTLRPLDRDAIIDAAMATPLVVTVEEHSIVGGLGGAVAEVMAETPGLRARLHRIGLPAAFAPHAGSRDYLADVLGVSPRAVLSAVRQALGLD